MTKAASWRQPIFADLLRGIRLHSSVYFRAEYRAPWAVRIAEHGTIFHIVAHGKCWLQLNGHAEPILLSAGDFIIVTRGDAHIMSDALATSPVNFFDLVKCEPPDTNRLVQAGGQGRVTKFVCGGMQFENVATDPLLAVLPPILYVKGTKNRAPTWLRATIEHILVELKSGGAGAAEVVTRLADILFIQAVRAYFAENADSAASGWLAAVRDPRIGPALALLHTKPQEPWSILALARRSGISRSAFADKFTELVGEPMLRYLTRLRINTAARRLRSSDDKLSAVAKTAGYESVPSFNRAFKRCMGITPGEYRTSSGLPTQGGPGAGDKESTE